uniref:Structural maintenance of chromosomes protein 5 n=2 Tax=Rhizochromulina marina TaxID=1034831 RepID=A0A7S2SUR7_9STRA|mmetsp:Transcript_8686/g.24719  ORF Transcript_8686/g.24719 Transcript_8686/m.24719 type:complete len:168 (+) Transcript_8686:128-631(+)
MRSLGNQGRIEMDKGATYKEWGIKILVSFRQGLELEVLRKNFQSGGERSVSTIMYLMALQDMVRSPFRVVDEINQGMDERNERIVFRRIVENSTGPESPQYFLITPKLLQGLTAMEHDDVTVLVVFNGPWNIRKHTDWDLKSFIEKRRAGKRARLTNGGEAGEPVTA